MVLANEVYTGAGLSATMVPEMDFELSEAFGSNINSTGNLCLALGSDLDRK